MRSHMPFAPWCQDHVFGRGQEDSRGGLPAGLPVKQFDYGFLGLGEKGSGYTLPMIMGKDQRSGYLGGGFAMKGGDHIYSVSIIDEGLDLDELGYVSMEVHSDDEKSVEIGSVTEETCRICKESDQLGVGFSRKMPTEEYSSDGNFLDRERHEQGDAGHVQFGSWCKECAQGTGGSSGGVIVDGATEHKDVASRKPMKKRKESDDEGGEEEPRKEDGDGPKSGAKKQKLGLIPVWRTWTRTWVFVRGPCRVVEIRAQLHADAAAVDIYAYADDDPPDPDPLDSPLAGFLLVLPGDRLRATLARGAPARLNSSIEPPSGDPETADNTLEDPQQDQMESGMVENAIKIAKRQIQVIRLSAEDTLGKRTSVRLAGPATADKEAAGPLGETTAGRSHRDECSNRIGELLEMKCEGRASRHPHYRSRTKARQEREKKEVLGRGSPRESAQKKDKMVPETEK